MSGSSTSPAAAAGTAVAEVSDLHVTFVRRDRPDVYALRGIDLRIAAGEIHAVVGESGSGKSVLSSCLLGLLPERPLPVVSGVASVKGVNMVEAAENDRRRIRRLDLGAVFQDPMASLDPTMRIGRQVMEACGSREEAVRLLTLAGVPDAGSRLGSFPHELSGGLRQRVMIAIAVAGNPALIIADEPTTALDVTVQAQILVLLRRLRDDFGCSVLLVTHDLGVASQVADRVSVMYGGRLAEVGSIAEVLSDPLHPYTAALLRSRISLGADRRRRLPTIKGEPPQVTRPSVGCPFAPRCALRTRECDEVLPEAETKSSDSDRRVACFHSDRVPSQMHGDETEEWPVARAVPAEPMLRVERARKEFRKRGARGERITALDDVDLEIGAGESLAVVGESGSGKSTLLRAIAGLHPLDSGSIEIADGSAPQIVFQDAGASLTPWLSVGSILNERLRKSGLSARQRAERIEETLLRVGLDAGVIASKPRSLSGGQRQRVALARAVIVPPSLLLCDEPTSALDASRAATILNEIGQLRRDLSMSVMFVTHDLGAARIVADRIAVMYLGRIVEIGPAEQVCGDPADPYTRALLASVPEPGRPLVDPQRFAPGAGVPRDLEVDPGGGAEGVTTRAVSAIAREGRR